MHVTINGTPRELPADTTIAGLLKELGLDTRPCAVELNRSVVPADRHLSTQIHEHDTIELVTLVGGG